MISLTGTADRRRPPCVHLRGLRWLRMVLAWQAVLQVYRAVLDRDDVTAGMIVCIHTFGELAHWHPHIHALVSDGAFARDGTFVRVPEIAVEPFLKLWEKALFDLLLSEGRITEQIVEQMRSQVCLSSDPGAASLVNLGPAPALRSRPPRSIFQESRNAASYQQLSCVALGLQRCRRRLAILCKQNFF